MALNFQSFSFITEKSCEGFVFSHPKVIYARNPRIPSSAVVWVTAGIWLMRRVATRTNIHTAKSSSTRVLVPVMKIEIIKHLSTLRLHAHLPGMTVLYFRVICSHCILFQSLWIMVY